MVYDFGEYRVAQVCQEPRLALKGALEFVSFRESLFERDRAAQSLVNSFIDRAHAALAELANDAIATL